MIEIALQYNGETLRPYSPEDAQALSEYKPHQVLRARLQGFKKPRSVLQLRLFWGCCRQVAANTEDPNWNTPEKVAEQCKVRTRFVDDSRIIVKPDGTVHIPYRSISFAELPHMEACNWFDQAFEVMAKFLGCTVDQLVKSADV